LTTKKGEAVSAVYGFSLVLFKTIKENQPDFIAACFDFPAPTFRHREFKEYKATRPPTPKDLIPQIPKVKEILKALSIPVFEKEGFEADDLIATIVKRAEDKVSEIFVLTGDLDTLQLVDDKVKVLFLVRKMKEPLLYTEKEVIAKFGVLPKQIPDFKALVGDQSDNIPGVLGIGPKTAVEILRHYGNLENLYSKIEKEKKLKEKIRKDLIMNKEKVFLSKNLAKLKDEVEIDFDLKKCSFGNFDKKALKEVLEKFEFYSLLKRIPEITFKETKKLF
jgi:DNA polymerase-1